MKEYRTAQSASGVEQVALADRQSFVLPEQQWVEFLAMLDREPTERPRLRAPLTNPSVLEVRR
jgi:uncharacterized protein (DUF1778 family)